MASWLTSRDKASFSTAPHFLLDKTLPLPSDELRQVRRAPPTLPASPSMLPASSSPQLPARKPPPPLCLVWTVRTGKSKSRSRIPNDEPHHQDPQTRSRVPTPLAKEPACQRTRVPKNPSIVLVALIMCCPVPPAVCRVLSLTSAKPRSWFVMWSKVQGLALKMSAVVGRP